VLLLSTLASHITWTYESADARTSSLPAAGPNVTDACYQTICILLRACGCASKLDCCIKEQQPAGHAQLASTWCQGTLRTPLLSASEAAVPPAWPNSRTNVPLGRMLLHNIQQFGLRAAAPTSHHSTSQHSGTHVLQGYDRWHHQQQLVAYIAATEHQYCFAPTYILCMQECPKCGDLQPAAAGKLREATCVHTKQHTQCCLGQPCPHTCRVQHSCRTARCYARQQPA
jgi:hypothetical protein